MQSKRCEALLQAQEQYVHARAKFEKAHQACGEAQTALDELQLQAEAVVLQQVPMPVAVALLRAHCPGVEVSNAIGEDLTRACGQHPLALREVGTQLRIMCGEQGAAGTTPEHVLASLASAQDGELLQQQNVYHSAGWEDFDDMPPLVTPAPQPAR